MESIPVCFMDRVVVSDDAVLRPFVMQSLTMRIFIQEFEHLLFSVLFGGAVGCGAMGKG